jgi:NADH-quinone oxidoreductase subunit L
VGFPGFSGFFSKDTIIEAVQLSHTPGATYAYWCVLLGVFVTALYSFRLLFLVFHGKERIDPHAREHLHEPPWVVWLPLVVLAVPSVLIGWFTIGSVALGEFFGEAIFVLEEHNGLEELHEEFHGSGAFVLHALTHPGAFYLALAGAVTAWFLYLHRPELPGRLRASLAPIYRVLDNKYYFDWFNENVLAALTRGIGGLLWKVGDRGLIDGLVVNGSARTIGALSGVVKRIQTGYLYHYAFVMVVGLVVLIGIFVLGV